MKTRIGKLKDTVQFMHLCQANHISSVAVRELDIWDGIVEVFAITGHPKAQRCYAWTQSYGGKTIYLTVLEIPPVVSPRAAVRALLASKERVHAKQLKAVDWRSHQSLSPRESAHVAERRRAGPSAPLMVTCSPGKTNFSLVEQMEADTWRWAVFSSTGDLLDEDFEPTLEGAQRVGFEIQRLWMHRCVAKGLCRDSGQCS